MTGSAILAGVADVVLYVSTTCGRGLIRLLVVVVVVVVSRGGGSVWTVMRSVVILTMKGSIVGKGRPKDPLNTLTTLVGIQIVGRRNGLLFDAIRLELFPRITTFRRLGSPYFAVGQIFAILKVELHRLDVKQVYEFVGQYFFHFGSCGGDPVVTQDDAEGLGPHEEGTGPAFGSAGGTFAAFEFNGERIGDGLVVGTFLDAVVVVISLLDTACFQFFCRIHRRRHSMIQRLH
mmetsp:Transcript_27302/g.51214  ORF Transcript_27302/g.51214 Transcript_27302/m.51214 type:complete len:233 (-) Transcript_27302:273-971(-)